MDCPGFNATVVQNLNVLKKSVQSSVDVPAARIQKDGLQTWQWRPGVMDSTKSLIKILIETIRQWQIHCDLDLNWHDRDEPVKMSHTWRTPRSLEELT